MSLAEFRIVILVGIGGAAGSILRYIVSGFLTKGDFPWGTFTVNFSGTFLLAFFFFLYMERGYLSPSIRGLIFIGLFGGYTTFSTFGLETISLLRESQFVFAAANIVINAGICLVGAYLGSVLGTLSGG